MARTDRESGCDAGKKETVEVEARTEKENWWKQEEAMWNFHRFGGVAAVLEFHSSSSVADDREGRRV